MHVFSNVFSSIFVSSIFRIKNCPIYACTKQILLQNMIYHTKFTQILSKNNNIRGALYFTVIHTASGQLQLYSLYFHIWFFNFIVDCLTEWYWKSRKSTKVAKISALEWVQVEISSLGILRPWKDKSLKSKLHFRKRYDDVCKNFFNNLIDLHWKSPLLSWKFRDLCWQTIFIYSWKYQDFHCEF